MIIESIFYIVTYSSFKRTSKFKAFLGANNSSPFFILFV
jgi:hypothetical protein